jgi:hypothetical protein
MFENTKNNLDDSDQIFSKTSYTLGETSVRKTLTDMIVNQFNVLMNKVLLYIISTVLGAIAVVVWNMNSKLNELSGKYSNPDKTIESINIRLESLEKMNYKLLQENYDLKFERMKLKQEKK